MTTPFLRASMMALSVLAAGPALAQATDDDETTTVVEGETTTTVVEDEATPAVVESEAQAVETVTATEDDDGFDLGWLGLLGLLGLAGLGGRRREAAGTLVTQPTVTTDSVVTARPTTTTTHTTTPR